MNLGTSFGLMSQVTGERSLAGRPKAANPAQPVSPQAQRTGEVLTQSEQIVADLSPAEMAWWTFGGVFLSILAAIGGALAGAGPELRFRRFFMARPGATGTPLAVDNR